MSDSIRRRRATSEQVDYSDAVEIHNTRRLRITFQPFYINRTGPDQLSGKIIRLDKTTGQEDSISLRDDALRKLHTTIGDHLLISQEAPGSYVLIHADGTVSDDSRLVAEQVARAVEELLRTDGIVDHLGDLDLGDEIVHALRTDLRLRELREAVYKLESHLEEGTVEESIYQDWCERHSWAFGNAYVVNDQIRAISASDRIDLLLPRNLGGFRDLIELKRPDMRILHWDRSHKSWYWSAEASKAIGQCHRYLDVLHSEVGLSGLRDAPNVVAYHPRATIVIGRSDDWENTEQQALHGLNCRLSDISIISYDHLLAQAQRTLELVETPDLENRIYVPSEDDLE